MAECVMPASDTRRRPARPPPPQTNQREIVSCDFKAFKKLHDKVYEHINKGLSQDEQGQRDEAIENYTKGLTNLEEAMTIDAERVSSKDDEKDSVKEMQQKMTKTKMQIQYRLQSLQAHIMAGMNNGAPQTNGHGPLPGPPMETECPPSYAESVTGSLSDDAYQSIGDSIMSDSSSEMDSMTADATLLYCIPEEVQIFYITPEGFVSAPSYPSSLQMFKFTDEDSQESGGVQRPPAFMKVHDWFYPLVPGTSPALKATNGAYIFPDVTSQQPGSAVGLLLPNSVTPAERQAFEETLGSLTVLQNQQPSPVEPSAPPSMMGEMSNHMEVGYPSAEVQNMQRPQSMQYPHQEQTKGEAEQTSEKELEVEEDEAQAARTSSKISKGLLVAADWISWGVGKGAEKAGVLIKQGSTKLREKLNPDENPKPIDPRIQVGARYARQGAHVAVKVSSFIVTKLGEATVAVAREVAPHIKRQGEKLLPKSVTAKSEDGKQSKMDDVIEVAASGLKGASTVFLSLETAAKALGRNIANETVQTVNHKYGQDAGHLTENTLFAVGNVAMTAYNANHLGVKAIAKRAAKETGKEVLHSFGKNDNQQYLPPRPPPPNQ